MKKRRSVVIAFLLVAALVMGVGYAALTDVLDITGSADINQSAAEEAFNQDVYFKDDITIHESGNTSSVNPDNNDKASFTVTSLKGAGDTASFTYTIVNDGDVPATVTPSLKAGTGNTNSEYFDISSDWNGASKELAAHGGTLTYKVTVTLKKTPVESISGSFIIELTAVSNVDNGSAS